MSSVYITHRMRTVWHTNPRSGECWSSTELLRGYEVNGGEFVETTHTTLAGAECEKAWRERINAKFPFVMPRTARELNKARRLGLVQYA